MQEKESSFKVWWSTALKHVEERDQIIIIILVVVPIVLIPSGPLCLPCHSTSNPRPSPGGAVLRSCCIDHLTCDGGGLGCI